MSTRVDLTYSRCSPCKRTALALAAAALISVAGCAHTRNLPFGGEDRPGFFHGVDLSYVNELEDSGAVYTENGNTVDPYELFAGRGFGMVRLRLWHDPDWTAYSTLPDIERSIARARAAGMAVLLDFHYSDEWADPSKQYIPAAWEELPDEELAEAVYDYTYQTLRQLARSGLLPEFVQVGNETNQGMLKRSSAIDWNRQERLFNAGIRAVRDASAEFGFPIEIVLHIAQPENAFWWFRQAVGAGITDFDIIGLSYYPQWSGLSVPAAGAAVGALRAEFGREVMIVETGYPWTLDAAPESASNILSGGVREYGISVDGQRNFMADLTRTVAANGGSAVVYWEPAWIPTAARTRWGQGSHYENATFFDFAGGLHDGIGYVDLFARSGAAENPAAASSASSGASGAPSAAGTAALGAVDFDAVFAEANQSILRIEEPIGDTNLDLPQLDLGTLRAAADSRSVYIEATAASSLAARNWGMIRIYLDTRPESGSANDPDGRPVSVEAAFAADYALTIAFTDIRGSSYPAPVLHAWDAEANAWTTVRYSGASSASAEERNDGETLAVYRVEIPRGEIGGADHVRIAAAALGKGRAQGAADLLGTAESPLTFNEAAVVPWTGSIR